MNESVAAVIVTHNRLELLKKCIWGIKNQTISPSAIIIVNNDSSDGTSEWLNTQVDPCFIVIHQENLGGAGGFNSGMKLAIEKGFDWVWCMDDDGISEPETLERVVNHIKQRNDIKVINSIVFPIGETNGNVFGRLRLNYNFDNSDEKIVKNLNVFKKSNPKIKLIKSQPYFFNSSFIHKDVIEKIGYPITEFFIRGDETEYMLRIWFKGGFDTYTALDSIYYHPIPKLYSFSIFGKNILLGAYDKPFKLYYYLRNELVLTKFYNQIANSKNLLLKTFFKELILVFLGAQKINSFFENVKVILKAKADSEIFKKSIEKLYPDIY